MFRRRQLGSRKITDFGTSFKSSSSRVAQNSKEVSTSSPIAKKLLPAPHMSNDIFVDRDNQIIINVL